MLSHDHLVALYADGPIASVYLRLSAEPGDTGREIGLRWRTLRERLEHQGASDAALHPIDERVAAANPVDRLLVAFAGSGRLLYAAELPFCDLPDAAAYGPLPHVLPLLRWAQQWVPHLVVVVDRTGADVAAFAGQGRLVSDGTVTGPDDEIERNAPGGWAQGRYQHRAEDSWAHNATVVAGRVEALSQLVDAGLVVLAGDPRAVQLVRDRLPHRLASVTRTASADGEQRASGRPSVRAATVHALVRAVAQSRSAGAVTELDEAVGAKRAVEGLHDTVEALRQSAVAHLLVVDVPGDDRQATVLSGEPAAIELHDASGTLAATASRVPLVDALVRAAVLQSTDVTVLAGPDVTLVDGVAAVLRF